MKRSARDARSCCATALPVLLSLVVRPLVVAVVAGGTLLSLIARSAAAQTVGPIDLHGVVIPAPAVWGIFAAIAAAAMAGGLAWNVQRRRAAALAAEARVLRAGLAAREDALAAAPGAYAGWSASGEWIAGPGLAATLGAGNDVALSDFSVVLRLLADDDRAALAAAVERLRQDGQSFALMVDVYGRSIDIVGRAGLASGREGALVIVLWFVDASIRQFEINRRAAAVETARTEAQLFAELFDAVALPIWMRRADGTLSACNRAYARWVEAASPAIAVAEQRELVGARNGLSRELSARVVATGEAQSASLHVVVDGARRLLDISEVPLGSGHLAGFAIDRTAVEDAQTELARHIAAHRDVLEKLGTAIVIYGPDARVLFANSAFAGLWGLEESWLATSPTHGELLEELRARRRLPEQADFQAYKKQRLAFYTSLLEPFEELMHLPDERVLRTVVYPHPLGGLLYMLEDVTDRLTLERSYNTLIAVQRETLDNLHAAVAVFGADGRLKLHNQAFARIWKLPASLLEGEPRIVDIIDGARSLFRPRGDWAEYRAYLASRATDHVTRNGVFLRADGSVLDYTSVPLPDGATMFSYLDVTDSYNVERALRERNEALEAADRLKSEFITNVSYELRTPLNTIIGFTEILANQYFGAMNDRQTEYARGILESSRQLLALIDDILDLALIEAGRLPLDVKPVNIHGMLFSVFSLARDRARKQGIGLSLDCAANIGAVMADERRLRQALFNLVSNAMKYMDGPGEITLRARWDNGELILAVSDTGIGIPSEDQIRVFEKFERGSRVGRAPGLGIGLSLVKSFIELHGGRIDLQSEPGQGTTVTCYLPTHSIPGSLQASQ